MKMLNKLFVILFSLCTFICSAQTNNKPMVNIDSFITSKIEAVYKQTKVPGIFIGILQYGERKYFRAGFANVEHETLFDSSMIFEAGSITKTFTAYILESVLKEHSIAETASVINFLPDSVKENTTLRSITFYNLLNHTSGLPRLPDNLDATVKDQTQPYQNYTINDLFSYLKTCTPKPDGKSNYSNLGFGLLGVLAEIISKKTYDELLRQKIIVPFKMMEKNKKTEKATNKIQGYLDTAAIDFWKWNVLGGCGKLSCSASQMLNYLQYMSEPTDKNSSIIIDSLLSPTVALNNRVKVCRAWNTVEEKDKPIIYWHNGGTYGFSTFAAFLKGKSASVIVIVNGFDKNAVSDGLGIAIMTEMNK
jgi:CubicO group peptidase (beta-lactamase class C family)